MGLQTTSRVIMVRPFNFEFNMETAKNNYFQMADNDRLDEHVNHKALAEFDSFVDVLRSKGVEVLVFQDDANPPTPDSIFPNNWISTHDDGRVALYPLFAAIRRGERREEMIDIVADDFELEVKEVEDFTTFEDDNIFLEGTGSLVLDRVNQIAYACISPRTDMHALETFCDRFDFEPFAFKAYHDTANGRQVIYHTNVMMALGPKIAVVCLNAIDDNRDKTELINSLKKTNHKILEISEEQLNHFGGNMLFLSGNGNATLCVMSSNAFGSLRKDQIEILERHAEIVHTDLSTIEKVGGGSARCMIAEIFLPRKIA